MTPTAPLAAALWSRLWSRWAIFVVLLFLYLAGLAVSSAFAEPNYLFNILRQAAPVGIAAAGVTLVMILGGVDLSVGAIISLSAVVAAAVMAGEAANLPLAIAACLMTGAAIGLVNGLLVALSRVSPFILTLGTGAAVAGLTQMFTGGTAKGMVSPGFREFFNFRIDGLVPVIALSLIAAILAVFALERASVFGKRLFLIGSNPAAAVLCGLPVKVTTVTAYVLSGLLASVAGLMLLARSGVSSTAAGQGLEFQVLAAVVLGGTTFEGGRGGVAGTLAGVLVLAIAFNLVNISGLPYQMQLVVMGAIIIAASALYGQVGGRRA